MLQAIRDRAQGLIVWIIVGLIIITFALFGLSSYLGGGGKAVVATVNGTEITQAEFLREYQNMRERLQQMLGENYRPELFDENRMKEQVLESLIRRALIDQALADDGFHVAFELAAQTIHGIPAFQGPDGKFSAEQYKQVMRVQGMDPDLFVLQVARDIAQQYLQGGIQESALVTDAQLQDVLRLEGQQREAGYFLLPVARYQDKVQLDDETIAAWYERNKQRFQVPEAVKLQYVEVDLEKLASDVQVSDEEIRAHYTQYHDNYLLEPERRRVRHILITVNDPAEDAKAKETIEALAKRIRAGEDFAEVAKAASQDLLTAEKGGDLGDITPGSMDPAFDKLAFSLKKGELGGPVRSRFGYHLIVVEDIKPARYRPLKDVRAQIRKELQMQQAEQRFNDLVARLNDLSFEIPDTLEPVAEELGLPLQDGPWITRDNAPPPFDDPRIRSAAFSDEVLHEGRNSELIELSDTRVMVLRAADHRPATVRPLKEVREQVVAVLRAEKARELAQQDAAAAIQALEAGTPPEAVAKQYEQRWVAAGLVSRQSAKPAKDPVEPALRKALFDIPRPHDGKPVFISTLIDPQRVAVVGLFRVVDGEADLAGESASARRQALRQILGSSEFTAWLDRLESQADISRHLDLVNSDDV